MSGGAKWQKRFRERCRLYGKGAYRLVRVPVPTDVDGNAKLYLQRFTEDAEALVEDESRFSLVCSKALEALFYGEDITEAVEYEVRRLDDSE